MQTLLGTNERGTVRVVNELSNTNFTERFLLL